MVHFILTMFGRNLKPLIVTDSARVDDILSRGVEEVIHEGDLRKEMLSGKQLRIKLGIDPTSPDIHLGRATLLLKLRDFQELGHQVVFIVGDATGVIGDTSDKESERPMLSGDEVKKNAESYFTQAGKLLDMKKVERHYNSEWLNKLTYTEIGEQADQFSVADFIARDNIRRRLDGGKRVSLREVLYPLMQGYDSVEIKADVELGGTDQRFNLLAGRTLQEHYGQRAQNIIMTGLLEGLDGRKMSSSWGNVIKLTDTADDMYGKVMSLKDDLMEQYFVRVTRLPLEEIEGLKQGHPRDMKMRLAREVVTLCHSEALAGEAEKNFVTTFQKGETPEDIKEVKVPTGTLLVDTLLLNDLVSSKTEFRRLVGGGAVTIVETGVRVTDTEAVIEEDLTIKVGKRRFIHIKVL